MLFKLVFISLFVPLWACFWCSNSNCGYNKYDVNPLLNHNDENEPRIIGGQISKPNQFPWMVHVKMIYSITVYNHTHFEEFACDGSIIYHQWILCAGHCFPHIDGYKLYSVNLTLGAHNLTDNKEKQLKLNAEVVWMIICFI